MKEEKNQEQYMKDYYTGEGIQKKWVNVGMARRK